MHTVANSSSFTAARWRTLCAALGVNEEARFAEIERAYAELHRAYHTAEHINECLLWFDQVSSSLTDAPLVELCIWLHDLVYEPTRSDNEARSAVLACEWFAALPEPRLSKLHSYILATKRHDPCFDDTDLQALIDIDLSILAASAERFAAYGQQVRVEYGFVPALVYTFKRHQFLKQIAQRQPLFHHPVLAPILEPRARINLA